MEEGRKKNTIIIIVGAVILGLFISISLVNISGLNDYYYSIDIVESTEYSNGKLVITTKEDMVSVCVKQTKTEPTYDSLCWIKTQNNKATISIYEYKTYYIWIKDNNNIISFYSKYNTLDWS